MAKHGVEGVYDGDPRRRSERGVPAASSRTCEAIERGLKVMDTTALSLCMDNDLPIYVFELADGQHPPRRRRRAGRHDHLDPKGGR